MAADEKITVEWIATAKQMLETIQKVDKGLERQEKALQKLTDTGKRGAIEAAGSFNKLEQELKENEAALKKLAIGSKEFDEQRKKVDALRVAMSKAKGELTGIAQETEKGQSAFAGMGTTMMSGVGSALALVAALQKVAQAQRDIVQTGADAVVEIDTLARKFQIQADLTDQERQVATKQTIEQASEAGVKADVGFETATALASTGFKDPINSGALKLALEGQQGTSFTGSPEQYVESTAQALSAYGLDKTPEELHKMNVRLAGMFKETATKAVDLTDFSKNASVLERRMPIDTAMAGFGALREGGTAENASMGMRQVTLGMMAPDREGVKAIEAMGLKKEQIDMIGESFTEALTTLKTAVDKLPREQQEPLLKKMFGDQAIANSFKLMNNIGRIQQLEGVQNDPAALARNVATAKESDQSRRNIGDNQELIDMLPNRDKLVELDEGLRARDRRQRAIEQEAAVEIGPVGAAASRFSNTVLNPIDETIGTDMVGWSRDIGKWLKSSDTKQDELIQLQREANEIARANAQRPAQPPQRQAPAARPRDAALPAATVP